MNTDNQGPLSYDQILDIFQKLGYPPKLIQQWSTPAGDVESLCRKIEELAPRKILEVGTFVGATTLAMAAAAPKDAIICTIDPNFPLKDEMLSLGSDLFGHEAQIRTHELGAKAAEMAKLSSKIKFLGGGFSTGQTYTSINVDLKRTVPIIGPELCRQFGPFDFIFIDGLHYSDAVLSDLELATAHLVPGGMIALHDALNLRWGPHVRRALFQFLEKRQDFVLFQNRNWDPLVDVSFLQHFIPGTKAYSVDQTYDQDFYDRCVEMHSRAVPHFARRLFDQHKPKSILDVGCGEGLWLRAFVDLGVKEVVGVDGSHEAILSRNRALADIVSVHDLRQRLELPKRYDLCLCLDVIEHIEPEFEENVIRSLVDASDTIIFSSPPPGQGGDGHVNERPIAHWIEKFWKYGYVFIDDFRPQFEGMSHIPETTYQLNTYTVRKLFEPKSVAAIDAQTPIISNLLQQKEARIENLFLQNLFMGREIAHARRMISNIAPPENVRDPLEDELNMVDFEIPSSAIHQGGGLMYIFGFRTHAAQVFARMSMYEQTVLYEDGVALSVPNVGHDKIRSEGMGRYSMWKNGVYFSTSDNSDPRVNGRKYTFRVPAFVKFIEAMPKLTIEKFGF